MQTGIRIALVFQAATVLSLHLWSFRGESLLRKPVEISKKVCVLGTFAAGKTSLVRRAVCDVFDEQFLTTVGVQISQKIISPLERADGKAAVRLKLILWDLAFIDHLNDTILNYFRGSHAAVVLYDLTRPESFDSSVEYLQPFRDLNPGSPVLFAGNKSDLISASHANAGLFLEHMQKHLGRDAMFASARTGAGVEELFQLLARRIVEVTRS